MKKSRILVLAIVAAVVVVGIVVGVVASTSGGKTTTTTTTGKPGPTECTNHVDNDGNYICDTEGCNTVVRRAGNFTYNTYMTTFPTHWNPHTYESATEGELLGYTTVGFYTFDYNENKDGFVIVPEMAAQMPIDVTADYVGDEWGIDEDETARAWKIVLRGDLAWEDGTPITANDFVESAKRLLDPKHINHRADSLYSGNMAIVGAKDYFYGGRSVIATATSMHKEYSEDLDAGLIFTLAPPSAETNNQEVYMRTSMGFPASYDATRCAAYLINNYLKGSAFTAEAAAAMENKTLAEIKADPTLKAAWEALIGWWQTEPNEELHFFLGKDTYPETEWSTVGIKAVSDTEIVLILEDALEGFYLHYSLGTDLGLVHIPTYDACGSTDENGIYTNTYATSVDTYKSFGPYKVTYFELDKQIVLEMNDKWYGYTDVNRAGQYQTTRVVFDWIENSDTAFQAFLQGKLTSKGLEAKNINDYVGAERLYYTDGASTWFVAMNPNEAVYPEWEEANPGYDKSIMTIKEFRMALSFSLNRQDFIKALDPMGSIGLGLFNSMICSNPDLGVMYREEEAAKDVLLEFWGVSQDDIGAGKLYADKDSAIASITGYNLTAAKELFNQAYDAAVAAGIYDGEEKVQISVGIPSPQSDFYNNGYEFLKNCWTEAVKGTKLEGKLDFVSNSSEYVQTKFGESLRTNVVDLLFGVGWQGSALNPYGLIGAYTYDQYRYDRAWNTSTAMMDFVIDGTTYRASVLDWTYAIEGEKIEIQEVGADGKLTGEVVDYSCGTADEKPEERILLLAAIEGAVLRNYDMIPTHNQASASLLSYKVNYGTEEYVYGVGRGGLQYMTYNYTDEEWDAYVKSQGGVLKYN